MLQRFQLRTSDEQYYQHVYTIKYYTALVSLLIVTFTLCSGHALQSVPIVCFVSSLRPAINL